MSFKPQSIQRIDSDDKSTRFYELREEGIRYVQELSGHVWTNFNAHDPGLILLETLCYAITELGYKSSFPIVDILQSIPDEIFHPEQNALYHPREIFSTHPVTPMDYRILLIDHLAPKINNVWVEMMHDTQGDFNGKYSLWLLADNEIPLDKNKITEASKQCMSAHRNLCEQVEEVLFIQRKRATISAHIELNHHSAPDKVLAHFFYRIEEEFLNPTFQRFTEEELISQGHPLEEIYNIPKTKHGYIDQKQLRPFPECIEVEELTQMLFKINQGVLRVDNFKVIIEDREYSDKIPLEYFLPEFLARDENNQIRCYQSNRQLDINYSEIDKILQNLKQGQSRNYSISLNESDPINVGRKRDITSVLPIENDLPSVFGLGNQTLSKNAGKEEIHQTKQLRSYLKIFNRFLENASSRLANTAAFFSIDERLYTRLYQKSYEEFTEQELQQRSLVLDHLLARFAIEFPKYEASQSTKEEFLNQIKVKEKCLQHLPELTANRGSGPNLEKGLWNNRNSATFCKWIHLILGNPDFTTRSVTQPMKELQSCIQKKNRYLKEVPILEMLRNGMEEDNYTIHKNRKYYVVWLELTGIRIYLGKRKEQKDALHVVQNYLKIARQINTRCKRVFLIEDFLFDANATFSIRLFFPNWISEIQNNRFKEFIKSQVVELLPTHIQAKFYALPYDVMQDFESFYQQWNGRETFQDSYFLDGYQSYLF